MNEKYPFNTLISKYRISAMGISMVSIMLYHQNWITNGIFFEWVRMLGYIGVEVFLSYQALVLRIRLRKTR